jgi:hypothetical protein
VQLCDYQDDLDAVSMSFDRQAIWIARMVEVPEKVSMPSSIEDVIPVVDQMIGLTIFLWLGGFDQILSLVVSGVRHNISRVVSHYRIFADRKASSKTDSHMFGWESFNNVIWVHRQAAEFVLTVLVDAVVLIAEYCSRVV